MAEVAEVPLRDFLSGIHVRRAHFVFALGLDPFVKDVMRKAFPESRPPPDVGHAAVPDPTADQRVVSQQVTARLYRAKSVGKRGTDRPLSSATSRMSGRSLGRHGAYTGAGASIPASASTASARGGSGRARPRHGSSSGPSRGPSRHHSTTSSHGSSTGASNPEASSSTAVAEQSSDGAVQPPTFRRTSSVGSVGSVGSDGGGGRRGQRESAKQAKSRTQMKGWLEAHKGTLQQAGIELDQLYVTLAVPCPS